VFRVSGAVSVVIRAGEEMVAGADDNVTQREVDAQNGRYWDAHHNITPPTFIYLRKPRTNRSMLFLDKWTMADTLTLLSHPERARHNNKPQQQEEQSSDYAEAYRELNDEMSGRGPSPNTYTVYKAPSNLLNQRL
jgi:hypothetical protein